MADDLSGQVAIVTGGGRGIGRAIALAIARSGAAVTVTARSREQIEETAALIEAAGGRALAVDADVGDWAAVERLAGETECVLGPVDILVNNAAQVQPVGPLWELEPEEWRRCMDTNLNGPFLCTRAVLPGMVERGRGCIINIITGVGMAAVPYGCPYFLSKGAVVLLTEYTAAEAGPHGVRAFAVGPGVVRTEMARYVVESPEGRRWHAWFQKAFAEQDRPAEDAAQLCLALALGRADALSGRVLSVVDDLPELAGRADEIQQRELRVLRMQR